MTEMKPNDFIDTVLSQWLEACGIITPGYIRQDDIDNAATLKDDEALQAISDYVKTNNLMSEQEFLVKSVILKKNGIISNVRQEENVRLIHNVCRQVSC